MGMIYRGNIDGVAITAIQDILEHLAPADAVVLLHEIRIQQHTDAGNAEAERLPVEHRRVTGSPTSGSGGGTITPRPLTQAAPSAGSTIERNNTTQLSGGTNVVLFQDVWDILMGYEYVATPETRIEISPSTRYVLRLPVAPADSITCRLSYVFEEMGG